jgi:hypothetical protein
LVKAARISGFIDPSSTESEASGDGRRTTGRTDALAGLLAGLLDFGGVRLLAIVGTSLLSFGVSKATT